MTGKEYSEKNKERIAERTKKRYWENHEEMLSRQREYRAKRKGGVK